MPETLKKISNTFHVGKQQYYGVGVASADAIYLIMLQGRNAVATGVGGAVGGLVGGLIAAGIAAAATKKTLPVQTIRLGDLDPAIANHPDWPLRDKPKPADKQVLIIPKSAVEVIEHPSFTNLLKFPLGETKISIQYVLFKGTAIRDYLVAAGWPLKWKGQRL